MGRFLIRLLSLFVLAYSSGVVVFSQEETEKMAPLRSEMVDGKWALPGPEYVEPWLVPELDVEPGAVTKAQVKLKAILAENNENRSNRNFPERFYCGSETTHCSLWLSPKSGYVLVYLSSCQHAVWEFSFGSIQMTDEWIELFPEGGNPLDGEGKSFFNDRFSTKMARVRHMGKEYLIPENSLGAFAAFCAGIRVYEDPLQHVDQFCAIPQADDASGISSKADVTLYLPSGFEHLRREPVRGKVSEIGKLEVRQFRESGLDDEGEESSSFQTVFTLTVTFDIGATQGIKKNMLLYLCVEGQGDAARVVEVFPNSCRAVIRETLYENDSVSIASDRERLLKEFPFKVGLPVSTSYFDVPETPESESAEKTDDSK